MGLFGSLLNGTVGVVLRAPATAIKATGDLLNGDVEIEDIADNIRYLSTGQSDDRNWDEVLDVNVTRNEKGLI